MAYEGVMYEIDDRAFQHGSTVAAVGAVTVLAGFFLPWVDFGSVVSASAPQLAGYEVPGLLRTASYFAGLVSGGSAGVGSLMVSLIWLVPLAAAIALPLAFLAMSSPARVRRFGMIHLMLAVTVLAGVASLFLGLLREAGTGATSVVGFVGVGLWATLLGMILLLVGGVMERRYH